MSHIPETATTSPLPGTDERGRIIPASPKELRARADYLLGLFQQWEENPQPEDPEGDREFLRAIDANRPEGRKLSEGYY
jgi:hypothetical protein